MAFIPYKKDLSCEGSGCDGAFFPPGAICKIGNDNKIQSYKMYERTNKNRGRVVSRDGVKYVLLNDKLYDYFSYKNAGILLSA